MAEPQAELPSVLSTEKFDAIIWSFFVVAFITTVLRLYTKLCIVRGFGLDDALIVAGQVCLYFSCSFMRLVLLMFANMSTIQLAATGYNAISHMQASALYDAYLMSLEAGRLVMMDTPASIHTWDLVFRYAFISDCIYLLTLPSVLALRSRCQGGCANSAV